MTQHDVLKPSEAAEYLRIGQSTIYKLLTNGDLPARKIGGSWRISRTILDEWLRESAVTNPVPQIGQAVAIAAGQTAADE